MCSAKCCSPIYQICSSMTDFCKVPTQVLQKFKQWWLCWSIQMHRQMDRQYQANKHALLFMQIHLEMFA